MTSREEILRSFSACRKSIESFVYRISTSFEKRWYPVLVRSCEEVALNRSEASVCRIIFEMQSSIRLHNRSTLKNSELIECIVECLISSFSPRFISVWYFTVLIRSLINEWLQYFLSLLIECIKINKR